MSALKPDSSRPAVVITTIESDQYSLRPLNSESGRPLATVPYQSDAVTQAVGENRRVQTWLHDSPAVPIRFELVDQAPSVTAEMSIGLTSQQAGIQVHQEIYFQIEHRDLATLSLNVPNGLQPVVRIAGEKEALRASLDAPTTWSFRLPKARRGDLRIEVDYLWPLRKATIARLSAPIRCRSSRRCSRMYFAVKPEPTMPACG